MLGRVLSIAVALTLLAAPALGAPADNADTPAHARALAAGYKALFLCSGIFEAHRTEAAIEAHELARPYPELRPYIASLPARIDDAHKTVQVAFDEHLPPRIAAWRPLIGCAQAPIGARPGAIADLPKLNLSAQPDADAEAWPMGDASAALATPPALTRVLDAAFDAQTYGVGTATTGVVVVRDGKVIAERYAPGFDLHTPSRTWSAAKRLAATLIGIAVRRGLLDPAKPAPIPEWRAGGDPRAAITLADLLHMASGLSSGRHGNRTDDIYFGGSAVTEKAVAAPIEAAPGARWKYANDDPLLALVALRAAVGNDQAYLAFPFRELLWKIGMRHTWPETDWRGNFVGSSQVWTTARDLARLGLLYLGDGMWRGERILPAGWAKYVATPGPAQPGSGPGYGALFWLWGSAQGLPAGTYAAEGSQGQYVMIIPAEHMVVVRRGLDGLAPGEAQFAIGKFTADVIATTRGR